MGFEEVFTKLNENPRNISEEAVRLIVKIADNILKNPTNSKVRTLTKSNSTISSKILPAKGALECLKIMGFKENGSSFVIPLEASLDTVRETKDAVLMWKDSVADVITADNSNKIKQNSPKGASFENVKVVTLPPLVSIFTNTFLRDVEQYFHNTIQFENKDLQARARKLIPIRLLEENAQKRMRTVQEHIKKNKLPDPDVSIQEFLILELLSWFKDDFFLWVNSPDCYHCGGKTKSSHMSTDPQHLVYTNRVELHRCLSCDRFTPFSRYNDLNILLETRRGRCGEWANTFTLFCRTMGWDARFVIDSGDHVWTEVYSVTQKRWLHCDPCENLCDTPLIYETGWKKHISYVMAYSFEEVQDVTWRYTSDHKETLKRRKACKEGELVNALLKLREIRQKDFPESRRKYLTKRMLTELFELMIERKPSENDKNGRTSGSVEWRLTRGEIEQNFDASYVWKIKPEHIRDNKVTIAYSAATDEYKCISDRKTLFEISKWSEGALVISNLFRKEEKDWKQVYLCRQEGKDFGTILWKIDLTDCEAELDTVSLYFDYTTFEDGQVHLTMCSDNKCIELPQGEKSLTTKSLTGSKIVRVIVNLKGGKGDVAWQHAQLFRQATDSEDFPFSLTLTFK